MTFQSFDMAIEWSKNMLLTKGKDVDAGSWQGYQTQGKPDLVTKEILNLQLEVPVYQRTDWVGEKGVHGEELDVLQHQIQPNLPWADDHFLERVSRQPTNPGVEYKNWPWWHGQEATAMVVEPHYIEGLFTHTYQERFWPKSAGFVPSMDDKTSPNWGIRYEFGDLDDVVSLLFENPYTRQATFPIFFPEDTGSVHGGRTPCTLHYHFMLREDKLHMWYAIRSCDLVRHFRDDLYLACRLLLWVLEELFERELRSDTPQLWVDVNPGTLFFTAYSFHVHHGDLHHVKS